ncbi:MAG: hypothetical protein HN348_35715, partial [Proteobacteria bacterium]|nr:hypothetical protein [Pseudomonadota bacterium]
MSVAYDIYGTVKLEQPELQQWEESDETLILAFRGGDERAFTIVFDRYRDRVTSYCWRMLRSLEEA